MAVSAPHTNNEKVNFRRSVVDDFYRPSRYEPYIGEDSTSPIVQITDLAGDGKEIRIPLIGGLTGNGVGTGQLSGNEERLDDYGMPMWADWARNAVKTTKNAKKEASYEMPSAIKSQLRNWGKRVIKEDLTDALLSIPTAAIQSGRGGTPGNRVNGKKWSAASTSDKNAWTAANVDRVLFGNATSNYSATFATAAANVDSTNDKMSGTILSLAKELATQTGYSSGVMNGKPRINPWYAEAIDEEVFLVLVGTRAFRDLKNDTAFAAALRDARARENGMDKKNPLLSGGALLWDGLLIKSIPDITQRLILTGVGSSSIDVEPFFLLGQGAIGHVMGQMPKPTGLDDTDYGFLDGYGIEAQYGTGKIAKATMDTSTLIDWGMVTGFVSGVAG